MTSSSTTIKAVSNGGTTRKREHGLIVLRNIEAKALVSLANDVISQTARVGHELFDAIYDKERTVSDAEIQRKLEEALVCWQAADHYLRMFGSVVEEREYGPDLQSVEPAF